MMKTNFSLLFYMKKQKNYTKGYLLGEGKHASYYNETVKRLEDIQTLDGSTKSVLFNIIDTFLRDAKARKAYA